MSHFSYSEKFNDDIYETKPRYCTAIFHRLTRELLLIIVDPDTII